MRQGRICDIGLFLDLGRVPLLNLQLRLVTCLLPESREGSPWIVVGYKVSIQVSDSLVVNGLLWGVSTAIRDDLNVSVFDGAEFARNRP